MLGQGEIGVLTTADRFWGKVQVGAPAACWPWAGALSGGYGMFWVGGRSQHASRVSYAIANGPIPGGLYACHSCDNPRCVNPAHLFLGSQQDNVRDMHNKRRGRESRKTHCPQGHEYSGDNLMFQKSGARFCRTCHNARSKIQSMRKRAAAHA